MMNRMNELDEATEAFVEEMYIEHLDEASFLYVQRLNSIGAPYRSWRDMDTLEYRIQAHVTALVQGADKALEICQKQAEEGGPGTLYTVVRVFSRHKLQSPVKEIIGSLDPMNMPKVTAVISALNQELPTEWHPFVEQMLLSLEPVPVKLALAVITHKRLPMGNQLVGLLNRPHDETFVAIIQTLGRLGFKSARGHLFHLLDSDKEPDFIKHEIRMAFLRFGEKGLFPVPADRKPQEPAVYLAMGLGGDALHLSYLKDISRSDDVCNESLLALGLLGDSSSVDILVLHLNGGACSEAASLALNLITGANLYEDAFIPDPIDEDMLFADEREKLKRGEPLYEPGKEPGETVNRLSQDRTLWNEWWMAHQTGFNPQTKYRYGKPYGPSGILETLESERNPASLRQLAFDELVVRYDPDLCFDITQTVAEQRKVIETIRKRN